ncbi:hypothetical protein [Streptomyces sp. NPDC058382]|uniref:hypothetical protein n=1 Tax=unclassified Streptomyces TaxID=2593676 RepID=UPI0036350F0D
MSSRKVAADLVLDRLAHRAGGRGPARTRGRGHGGREPEVALALLDSSGPTSAALAPTRPGASLRVRESLEAEAPGFSAPQRNITR